MIIKCKVFKQKIYINTMTDELKLGKYKHYKGKQYKVIGFARHRETLEKLVFYKALYNSKKFENKALWVRPKSMFFKIVNVNGKKISRFEFIE